MILLEPLKKTSKSSIGMFVIEEGMFERASTNRYASMTPVPETIY